MNNNKEVFISANCPVVTVVVIPGDGIGPEVTEATLKVLKATKAPLDFVMKNAGEECLSATGSLLPEDTIEAIKTHKLALKGPTNTPVGTGHRSINVQLRKMFNLYANVRPVKNGSFWGVQKKTMIHEERDLNLLSFALSLEGRVVASSYDLSPLQDLGFTIHSLNKSSKEYLEHMALENLQKSKDQELIKSSDHELLLKELQIDKLEKIECYDISHLQGTSTAGSRVVWEHGALRKNLYRHYNIRHQEGNNDFLSLSEVLRRRLEKTEDAYPDVLLIDGGKGQVEAVEAVVKDLNIQGVLVWGIAKARVKGDFKDAEVFATEERLVKNGEETPLTPGSLSYRLITTLRNEAHRFALKHHRQLRSKNQGFKK